MTKTAYAQQLTPEELAEHTSDMAPEEREEFRLENATDPLFDMWLRFVNAFGDRAIDRLDVSDEDAETVAKKMESLGPAGASFAYLLRSIAHRRLLRVISHKVSTLWARAGKSEGLSYPEIHERYAKLPKGTA